LQLGANSLSANFQVTTLTSQLKFAANFDEICHAAAKWPEFSLTFAFMGRIVRVAT